MTKAKYLKDRERKLKEEGLCVRCAVSPAMEGKTCCRHCIEVKMAKRALRKKTPASPTATCKLCHRVWVRSTLKNRICPACSDDDKPLPIPTPPKVRRDGAASAWHKVGWCIRCGNPERLPNRLICQGCQNRKAQP